MPIDPDVQPLLDAKATKVALAALTARVVALEAKMVVQEAHTHPALYASLVHSHPEYALVTHTHGTTPPPVPGTISITPSTTHLIGAAGEGAIFQFAAGVYPRLTIAPKTGQTFLGVGAVLDGENVTAYAFRPTGDPAASDVTITGFEIKNYTPVESPGWNEGAITSKWYGEQGGGSGWLLEDLDVHHNRGAGIMVSDGVTVRNSSIHHNYAIGLKVYWVESGALVEGNEIFANNFDGPPDFNETGGTKFAWTSNLIVRNNHVYDNGGPGLWTDIDNSGTVYTGNTVTGNAGPGIVHEVSFDAEITNNKVTNNGHGAQGSPGDTWMWGAGILIANSLGVIVAGNKLDGNEAGLGVIHQNRVEDYGSGPHAYQTGATFTDNTATSSGWSGAVQDVGIPGYFTGKVAFVDNDYIGAAAWVFGGLNLSWAQWQALGHDLTGSST